MTAADGRTVAQNLGHWPTRANDLVDRKAVHFMIDREQCLRFGKRVVDIAFRHTPVHLGQQVDVDRHRVCGSGCCVLTSDFAECVSALAAQRSGMGLLRRHPQKLSFTEPVRGTLFRDQARVPERIYSPTIALFDCLAKALDLGIRPPQKGAVVSGSPQVMSFPERRGNNSDGLLCLPAELR